MKKIMILAAAACTVLAACTKEQQTASPDNALAAKIRLSFAGTKAETIQTTDEAKVNSIRAFVFNVNSLDGYAVATSEEISAKSIEVSCTQGTRDIWVIVNGPASLDTITTKPVLMKAVSNLTADNAKDSFVMVGKAEDQTVTANFSKEVKVDRIVSRVRLFQVKRDMSKPAHAGLAADKFKITRVYMTCVIDNACYDLWTPKRPTTYNWLSAIWANSAAIATGNAFIYDKLGTAASVAEDASYGTAYAAATTAATHTFYVYPQEYETASNPLVSDQMKLVVECLIQGDYYTYPIPLGKVENNKTYDVKMLTITRLGNNSDGDDEVDPGEDDIIKSATATFSVTVNDWTQVLTFGGAGGVTDGNITI